MIETKSRLLFAVTVLSMILSTAPSAFGLPTDGEYHSFASGAEIAAARAFVDKFEWAPFEPSGSGEASLQGDFLAWQAQTLEQAQRLSAAALMVNWKEEDVPMLRRAVTLLGQLDGKIHEANHRYGNPFDIDGFKSTVGGYRRQLADVQVQMGNGHIQAAREALARIMNEHDWTKQSWASGPLADLPSEPGVTSGIAPVSETAAPGIKTTPMPALAKLAPAANPFEDMAPFKPSSVHNSETLKAEFDAWRADLLEKAETFSAAAAARFRDGGDVRGLDAAIRELGELEEKVLAARTVTGRTLDASELDAAFYPIEEYRVKLAALRRLIQSEEPARMMEQGWTELSKDANVTLISTPQAAKWLASARGTVHFFKPFKSEATLDDRDIDVFLTADNRLLMKRQGFFWASKKSPVSVGMSPRVRALMPDDLDSGWDVAVHGKRIVREDAPKGPFRLIIDLKSRTEIADLPGEGTRLYFSDKVYAREVLRGGRLTRWYELEMRRIAKDGSDELYTQPLQ